MKWEIKRQEESQPGDIKYKTRFAWLPTRVLSKITMTDHIIWLEVYIEEQEYRNMTYLYESFEGGGVESYNKWITVAKTIHI
jgi:hypothetical protein